LKTRRPKLKGVHVKDNLALRANELKKLEINVMKSNEKIAKMD
jgi:hypothetical protein